MRQRDEHIRRYAELLEAARDVQSTQNAAIESKREDGRGHRPQGIPRQIAEAAIVPQNAEQIIKPRGRPVTFYVPVMCHGVAGRAAKTAENGGKACNQIGT